MRVLELLFFSGLTGCAVVVVFSWISIFKSGFSSKDEIKIRDKSAVRQPGPYDYTHPELGGASVFSTSSENRFASRRTTRVQSTRLQRRSC